MNLALLKPNCIEKLILLNSIHASGLHEYNFNEKLGKIESRSAEDCREYLKNRLV